MNPSRTWPRPRGLTLVERAVVIALLALFATLATPYFADVLARHRLRATAETLLADFSDARFLAAQRGQPVHVAFQQGAAWCWVVANTAPCDCLGPPSCRLKRTLSGEHQGVDLSAASDARFEPEGLGRGSAELRSNRGHVLRVEVAPTGRARLCSPGSSDTRYPAC